MHPYCHRNSGREEGLMGCGLVSKLSASQLNRSKADTDAATIPSTLSFRLLCHSVSPAIFVIPTEGRNLLLAGNVLAVSDKQIPRRLNAGFGMTRNVRCSDANQARVGADAFRPPRRTLTLSGAKGKGRRPGATGELVAARGATPCRRRLANQPLPRRIPPHCSLRFATPDECVRGYITTRRAERPFTASNPCSTQI